MPSSGFEPAIPAIKRLQTYALDRSTTGIGTPSVVLIYKVNVNYTEKLRVILRHNAVLCAKMAGHLLLSGDIVVVTTGGHFTERFRASGQWNSLPS
jgi:hypothetical protein